MINELLESPAQNFINPSAILDDLYTISKQKFKDLLEKEDTDITSLLFQLVDFGANFFDISNMHPLYNRILFASFLSVHHLCFSTFDRCPECNEPEIAFIWHSFSSIFKAITENILPFSYNDSLTDLMQSVQGLALNDDDMGRKQRLRQIQTRVPQFIVIIQKNIDINITSDQLYEIISIFHNLKSDLLTFLQETTDQPNGYQIAPPQLYHAIQSIDYQLRFSLAFIQIKEIVDKINSICKKNQYTVKPFKQDRQTLLQFVKSTTMLLLLENRVTGQIYYTLGVEKQTSEKPSESANKDKQPQLVIDRQMQTVLNISELLQRIYSALTLQIDDAIPALMKDLNESIKKLGIEFEKRDDIKAVESLGILVQSIMIDNYEIVAKFQEFKRTFLSAMQETTCYKSLCYCLSLLMELKSRCIDNQILRSIENVLQKVAFRLIFSKFMDDQQRIRHILNLYLSLNEKNIPDIHERQFVNILTSSRLLGSFSLLPLEKPVFLQNYNIYLNLMDCLINNGGKFSPDYISWHPSSKILSTYFKPNNEYQEVFYDFKNNANCSLLFATKMLYKLTNKEIEASANFCDRNVWFFNESQRILHKTTSLSQFFRLIDDFHSQNPFDESLEMRDITDDDYPELIDKLLNLIMKLQKSTNFSLFSRTEHLKLCNALLPLSYYLMYRNVNPLIAQNSLSNLLEILPIPRCPSILVRCYKLFDLITRIEHNCPETSEIVQSIKTTFLSVFSENISPEFSQNLFSYRDLFKNKLISVDPSYVEEFESCYFEIEKFATICQFMFDFMKILDQMEIKPAYLESMTRVISEVNQLQLLHNAIKDSIQFQFLDKSYAHLMNELEEIFSNNTFSKFQLNFQEKVQSMEIKLIDNSPERLLGIFKRFKPIIDFNFQNTIFENKADLQKGLNEVEENLMQYVKTNDRYYLSNLVYVISRLSRPSPSIDSRIDNLRSYLFYFAQRCNSLNVLLQLMMYPFEFNKSQVINEDIPSDEEIEEERTIIQQLDAITEHLLKIPGDTKIESGIQVINEAKLCGFARNCAKLSSINEERYQKIAIDDLLYQEEILKKRLEFSTKEKSSYHYSAHSNILEIEETLNQQVQQTEEMIETLRAELEVKEREAKEIQTVFPEKSLISNEDKSAIELLLADEDKYSEPEIEIGNNDEEIDSLLLKIAKAKVTKSRLKRTLDKLEYPTGRRSFPIESLVANDHELGKSHNWVSPYTYEAAQLRKKLSELQAERESLFEKISMKVEHLRQMQNGKSLELNRILEEMNNIKNNYKKYAHTEGLKRMLVNYTELADRAFYLLQVIDRKSVV